VVIVEEDKILIAFRNYNKFYKEENGKLTITIDLDLKTDLDKALENLLTRYKQLEEENKRLNNHNIIGRIDAIKIEDLEPVLKPYYIPKSKIKEKIEELKKEADYKSEDNPKGRVHFVPEPCDYQIQVLQELLEEE
jgi:hypothetical protein